MADIITLKAQQRTEFGKGAARRIRSADLVPAVLYGHDVEPTHVTLDGHAVMMALKNANALLSIEIEGGETRLAVAREVQIHPIRRTYTHLDLIAVKKGEKIEAEVPLHIEGEAFSGTVVSIEDNTLAILVDPTSIPEAITVDIAGRKPGEHVYAKDIVLPAGVELVQDPEYLIVNVAAEAAEETEDEAAEGEEA
ncbi:50S ribosomal protein L25/general stress protein Ctc [Brevibacterium samyangense]|uniref:Large ribosomal subunit protein bL25 n=1 Tax=Brevibacterium samyangense TaxID=366888 RepID=A0ABN2TQS2_9MICO